MTPPALAVDGSGTAYVVFGVQSNPMEGFSRPAGSASTWSDISTGLPLVRTSVAHGTAYDIAGQGIADPISGSPFGPGGTALSCLLTA